MAVRASDITGTLPPTGMVDIDGDRELVERFQRGDQAAFDELYRRHYERLRGFCRRRVGDPHTAEEIAQEAFARAYVTLPNLTGERRFYPWLTVVAGRLCIDHHRRQARLRPTSDLDPGTVDYGDHDDRLVRATEHADLDRALTRITDRHRQVLDLRERRGLTYDEIADELEVTHSTVETLLHRARRALRREYLAVSGERRLAGLGALAWLSRRTADLRARLGDRLPELAAVTTPVGAGAVSAMIALLPGVGAEPPHPAPPPPVVVPAAALVPEAGSVEPPAPAPPPGPARSGTPATAAPAHRGGSAPTVEAAGTGVYLDGATERAEQQPERSRLGPAVIGRDGSGFLADVAHGVDTTVRKLLDGDKE